MATMCPLDGCKRKKGLCGHDKMMIGVAAMIGLLAIGHWGLGLF